MTINRPRRLRSSEKMRNLVRETRLHIGDFIHPIFVKEGDDIRQEISTMPGHFQLSIDHLDKEIIELKKLGIFNIILFGIPAHKDAEGSASLKHDGVVQKAIKHIKSEHPEMLVMADVCFCEYTNHGHCGIIENDDVHNDKTLEILAKQAVSFAKAGADIIAPSGMMDGMVETIRYALDEHEFTNIPIMSYSVKYASHMYGPFREAAEGAPKFGDRKTYQMDFSNSNEAIKEASIDAFEGADFLMVKPAHTYLDIIHRVKTEHPELPLVAYHTSGEFAMIKAAAKAGMLDEKKGIFEVTTAIKRAGADLIIFAKSLAK